MFTWVPALLHRCANFAAFPRHQSDERGRAAHLATLTFDHVAVDRGPELLPGSLVEVLAVDDPHLFEESRLAALASAEQKDLHQPLHVGFLPGETSVDLLGLAELLDLAAVQQADGQTNF